MTLQVRPHEGVSLERWSLSEYRPYPAAMPSDVNETTYFVYYSHGETPATPWTFSLHLKVIKWLQKNSVAYIFVLTVFSMS